MGARTLDSGVIIGTAGHIDHGKTALVKALTGIDTDRLPEEKKRGITMDLGFAPLALDDIGVVGIVDVPGHEDFVRSMLVGASGIDVGLLVVASDEGVMPQTREHLLILELLGIPRLVVALTKSDLVDAEWMSLLRADVNEVLGGSAFAGAPLVACSARSGAGLHELRLALRDALAQADSRDAGDIFRLPVDRAFSVRGTGTVVTGTVWSGSLRSDEIVRILPEGKQARARRVEQHGKPVDVARSGTRTAVALAGVDVAEVARGSVIVTDPAWRATEAIDAVLALETDSIEIGPRTRLRFHSGASETGARVISSDSLNTRTPALVRIRLEAALPLRGGDRFVLRLPAPVRTIGGGFVVDPYARRHRSDLHSLSQFEPRSLADDVKLRLEYLLAAAGTSGVAKADLPVRLGVAPARITGLLSSARARSGAHNLFAAGAVEQVMAVVQRIVAEYEVKSPLSPGVPTRTLREALHVDDELADISIRELESSGHIETAGPVLRRRGWVPTPTDKDVETSDRLAHDICAGNSEPPGVNELTLRYGGAVPMLLRHLERQGRIVQVESDRYYDREVLEGLVAKLKRELVPGRVYSPAQLRDLFGSSRKFLIPFLEFCDRSGVTERREEGRMLRQTAGAILDTSRIRT